MTFRCSFATCMRIRKNNYKFTSETSRLQTCRYRTISLTCSILQCPMQALGALSVGRDRSFQTAITFFFLSKTSRWISLERLSWIRKNRALFMNSGFHHQKKSRSKDLFLLFSSKHLFLLILFFLLLLRREIKLYFVQNLLFID